MRMLRRVFQMVVFLVVLAVGATAWQGYQIYEKVLKEKPLYEKVEEIRNRPDFVPLDQLPEDYREAVVAVEDHRFYRHFGLDLIALGRAAKNNLLAGSMKEGGSTITQQLARNLYFTQEKSFSRKAAEAFLALKLERVYTKDEILELYVNTIYFGDGYYGIRQASLGYYGKEPSELNFEECTMLAGLPNAPSVYAPTKNPELARQRQEIVVGQMEKYGYLK